MKASLPIHHILYKTINCVNNNIYIGVHSTSNLNDGYLGSGKIIQLAISKYGKNNFKREIIQEFETREAALAAEAVIVDGEFIRRFDTYNCNLGGGHNWYGMASTKDKDGNIIYVTKDDPRYVNGELVHINTNRASVMDNMGNRFKVNIDDPRLKTGELVGVTAGRTNYKDSNGNTVCTSKYDPRVASGELTHFATNRVSAKDKGGNTLSIMKDDARLKTGELVGVMKDFKHKIVTCPWCGKIGSCAGLKSTHFNYCHKNPNRKLRKEWKTLTCPHCEKRGKPSPMKRWHFDNCKMK